MIENKKIHTETHEDFWKSSKNVTYTYSNHFVYFPWIRINFLNKGPKSIEEKYFE